MMDEAAAVSNADRIRASQGNHEAEVSCTGELGLHQRLIICEKNPGHQNFIPASNFNIEHLPSRYQDKYIVNMVRAASDLTCRLSVPAVSQDRPETWPDGCTPYPFSAFKGKNFMMTGTGWLTRVDKYTEEDISCKCEECRKPGTRTYKTWGKVYIRTACHVVYDQEEARHTKFQFFYDSPETDVKEVLTLTGLRCVRRDLRGDWCKMVYVTHNMELLDIFEKMYRRWQDLHGEVYNKFLSNKSPGVGCDTNTKHDLCIVVSHPHGCSKGISVGTWKHRHMIDKHDMWGEKITYSYNTPTCPGSSGGPVITMWRDTRRACLSYDPPSHSQGGPGNDNISGVGKEFV